MLYYSYRKTKVIKSLTVVYEIYECYIQVVIKILSIILSSSNLVIIHPNIIS